MASYKKGQPANRSKAVKKRSYASRTPQARSYKTPGKVRESGMASYNAIRLMKAATEAARNPRGAIKTSKGRPAKKKTLAAYHGEEVVRTKAVAKSSAQFQRQVNQVTKRAIKRGGENQQPLRWGDRNRARGPVSSRMTKAPVKPSKARRGPSNPKRRKR